MATPRSGAPLAAEESPTVLPNTLPQASASDLAGLAHADPSIALTAKQAPSTKGAQHVAMAGPHDQVGHDTIPFDPCLMSLRDCPINSWIHSGYLARISVFDSSIHAMHEMRRTPFSFYLWLGEMH